MNKSQKLEWEIDLDCNFNKIDSFYRQLDPNTLFPLHPTINQNYSYKSFNWIYEKLKFLVKLINYLKLPVGNRGGKQ